MTVGTRKPPSQFAEGSAAAVRPGHQLSAVVGGVDHDGVIRDAQVVELLEQPPDHAVVLDHAVGFQSKPGLTVGLRLEMRPDVHSC